MALLVGVVTNAAPATEFQSLSPRQKRTGYAVVELVVASAYMLTVIEPYALAVVQRLASPA